ncbi:uncharacterized protein BCR38DRAFT_430726 [Pseudomassariella vexata]|uniref:Uncharacterized protein n=1 Tax=Pseudomassariella vexata TaxID=1141098 RepID=A0A1Y2E5L8_9PEZI|nr:uncharacterized protein BCR38DRAFT_430726 [Pseudomassariella vexata]ORY66576.1 hypothetical protein BCR38DRAFT_430726 [Pseudomassariella vexata]
MLFAAADQCMAMETLAGTVSLKVNKVAGLVATVMLFLFNFFFAGQMRRHCTRHDYRTFYEL